MTEMERIQIMYANRDASASEALYAWHRSEVRVWQSEKDLICASLLARAVGTDLCKTKVLDVGCGTGSFLRTLVEWGAHPSNLVGTEFLQDRLDIAYRCSPPNIEWHLGGLDSFSNNRFDLVTANTVFSSILDDVGRQVLTKDMWRLLKPGGWMLVFDFRYNNPSNPNVRKVGRYELLSCCVGFSRAYYNTLLLAPPLARKIIPLSPLLGKILSAFFPVLRSHFCLLVQKPNNTEAVCDDH